MLDKAEKSYHEKLAEKFYSVKGTEWFQVSKDFYMQAIQKGFYAF